jgi:hypothetical protein
VTGAPCAKTVTMEGNEPEAATVTHSPFTLNLLVGRVWVTSTPTYPVADPHHAKVPSGSMPLAIGVRARRVVRGHHTERVSTMATPFFGLDCGDDETNSVLVWPVFGIRWRHVTGAPPRSAALSYAIVTSMVWANRSASAHLPLAAQFDELSNMSELHGGGVRRIRLGGSFLLGLTSGTRSDRREIPWTNVNRPLRVVRPDG